jgi:hypothetical protein
MKRLILFFLAVAVAGMGFADDYDEVKELLTLPQDDPTGIWYLSRINISIPGGENWIANSYRYTYIYTVDSEKNVKLITSMSITIDLAEVRYWDFNLGDYVDLEYDILEYVPGTQFGSKAVKIGDFNGDGIDEIFYIGPNNEGGLSFGIMGYDNEKGKIEFYIYSRLNMTSSNASPVGFYNYRGRDGLMIHVWDYMQERYFWDFCVWDAESRKYIDGSRIWENDKDYSIFLLSQELEKQDNQTGNGLEAEESTVTAVITSKQPEETALATVVGNAKSGQFYLKIIIGIFIIMLTVVILVLVVKKKRKKAK